MDKRLLDILVCPLCKSTLHLDSEKHELICKPDRLAYPIRNDIPVMLVEEAEDRPSWNARHPQARERS